jgi:hypothetical protein
MDNNSRQALAEVTPNWPEEKSLWALVTKPLPKEVFIYPRNYYFLTENR